MRPSRGARRWTPSVPDVGDRPVLVVPTPAGGAVHPAAAPRSWPPRRSWCSPAAATRGSTPGSPRTRAARLWRRELSLGDYVLGGGEVAVLVVVEAVARLLPGVLGNAESLDEESHARWGLLEAPVYTKPPQWRGLDVPAVLLSGDHGRDRPLAARRGAAPYGARRPDLLAALDPAL